VSYRFAARQPSLLEGCGVEATAGRVGAETDRKAELFEAEATGAVAFAATRFCGLAAVRSGCR
jgi:hypothetical protein